MAHQSKRDWEFQIPDYKIKLSFDPKSGDVFADAVRDELKDIERRYRESDKAAKAAAKQEVKREKQAKHHKRSKTIEADASGSTCFSALEWFGGMVTAEFRDGSVYTYEMTRKEAKDWFNDDSLGGYFNDAVR
jgi:hypothetical protein